MAIPILAACNATRRAVFHRGSFFVSRARLRSHLYASVIRYNLVPNATFPNQIQLREATDAVMHLIAGGVAPENIIIGGPLSHILHPLPSVEAAPVSSDTHFRGLLLLSAVCRTYIGREGSYAAPGAPTPERDVIPVEFSHQECPSRRHCVSGGFGSCQSSGSSLCEKLSGVSLSTVGERDFLRDGGERLYVRFLVEKDRIHGTPIFDFIAREKRLSELTPIDD
ncbi:uncharacterized protein BT62DRAFT_1075175 [Guyanagaster necrorhizus]|uniref:Uncharacterized protein n=1 Tax=Guyanagaster necrorhizus TaxID=856835 RepID=A0A9P8AVF0_9AGAR|nr:uncharacterized protein BT62DRAFT_1075175 [Guyanagaster necrorhizus MCA 3950]KAG7447847.1 hypothetical protein BT62DRAFT_1075175 [Guyanagaster necrorhizus MCA 3950]